MVVINNRTEYQNKLKSQKYLPFKSAFFAMPKVRCCPSDCSVKSDWEKELQIEKDLFKTNQFHEVNNIFKVLGNPSRLKIILLLLNRDHCVCELIYILRERQNLVSYNLGILKRYGMVDFYNRSKHKYYRLGDDAVNIARMVRNLMGNKHDIL